MITCTNKERAFVSESRRECMKGPRGKDGGKDTMIDQIHHFKNFEFKHFSLVIHLYAKEVQQKKARLISQQWANGLSGARW
jgi:hypothetical protein